MRNVARLKTPRRTCMHAQPALSSTTIKTPPLLFFTSPREASVICTCTMLLLRYTTAKSTVARSLRNPALNTIHVFGRLCSTTSEYCCRPQTTLIRRYHHEAVIGHAPFPQQYRHYSSSSIDHKIPAVFVDASKNAGIGSRTGDSLCIERVSQTVMSGRDSKRRSQELTTEVSTNW